jgi:hypothetical protein
VVDWKKNICKSGYIKIPGFFTIFQWKKFSICGMWPRQNCGPPAPLLPLPHGRSPRIHSYVKWEEARRWRRCSTEASSVESPRESRDPSASTRPCGSCLHQERFRPPLWEIRWAKNRQWTPRSRWFYDTSTGVATGAARCGSFVGGGFGLLVASYEWTGWTWRFM